MQIVIWKKNGLRLRVLGRVGGKFDEALFSVCKETAPNPAMATFSVRVDETEDVSPCVCKSPDECMHEGRCIDRYLTERVRCTAQSEMDSQHNAQLEGLAIGLEQRGEKSAAHLIRLALKRLSAQHRPLRGARFL